MKGDLEAVLLLVVAIVAVATLSKQLSGPTERDELNQLQINRGYEL